MIFCDLNVGFNRFYDLSPTEEIQDESIILFISRIPNFFLSLKIHCTYSSGRKLIWNPTHEDICSNTLFKFFSNDS